jgi:hypothetical protein
MTHILNSPEFEDCCDQEIQDRLSGLAAELVQTQHAESNRLYYQQEYEYLSAERARRQGRRSTTGCLNSVLLPK